MWIILQTVGSAILAVLYIYIKKCGLCLKTWGVYIIVVCLFTSWIFPLSFIKGPTFFQVWFLGIVMLSLFGALSSVFYFNEMLNIINYIGAGLALIGITLLIL